MAHEITTREVLEVLNAAYIRGVPVDALRMCAWGVMRKGQKIINCPPDLRNRLCAELRAL